MQDAGNRVIVNPYLHFDEDRIYNPLNDRMIIPGDRHFAVLKKMRTSHDGDPCTPGLDH